MSYKNSNFCLKELAEWCFKATQEGIKFLLTHTETPEIYKLFVNYDYRFNVYRVKGMNIVVPRREVVIRNYRLWWE